MKLVAYYRVSTKKQGASGLGLEAQQAAVQAYAKQCGGTIAAEFVEVESGKRADRPKLAEAISRARGLRGVLVVAKLDRLARSVAFTSALMDSGVEFVACDNPHANRLTIHILAAVAENEARAASQRTTEALAAAKARGVKLGSARPDHWKGREHLRGWKQGLPKAIAASVASRNQRRDDCYKHLMPEIRAMRASGLSLSVIADRLNEAGHQTTGFGKQPGRFAAMTVKRLLDRD
jgi:DNA invertase Pin-like site-specific DNA recombinase